MKHKFSILERTLCWLCIAALLLAAVGCGKQANCVNGHSYEKQSEQAPGCTEAGSVVYICSVCGDRRTEVLPATGHETGDWIMGENGTHYHICTVCGEKTDIAAHSYDEVTHLCTFCGAYDPAAVTQVEKPTAGITKRAYTGSPVLYLPDGYDENTMSVSGNIQTRIGQYSVTVSLKDPEHSVWADGSTDSLTFVFTVTDEKITVPVPTESTLVYVYNGAVISYRPTGYNASLMSVENGDQTQAGSYTVSVSLLDTEHYLWADGTVEQKNFVFTVEKCLLVKPTAGETVYRYTGQDLLFLPEGFDPATMTVSGNEQTLAGNYKAAVSLLDDRNYSWTDGTTETVEIFWTVEKALITKPTSDNNVCVYTGEPVTFRPNGFNSATMTISNNTATALGSYKATVSLKDSANCIWADGSDGPFEILFTIEEKTLPYTVTKTSDTVLEILNSEGSTVYKSIVTYPAGSSFKLDQDTGLLTLSYEGTAEEGLSYSFSGTYYGALLLEAGEENELTLNLEGFSLIGKTDCPLLVSSAKSADISAKSGTENAITDARGETEETKSAVYAACDLKLKGSGSLSVISENNNGIHSKDNLEVQKLTLYVKCADNALKGNDKVRISSGTLTLIARKGDGIKTSNTALSSKGNQKGSVSVEGGV